MKAIELTAHLFGQWFAYVNACLDLPMTAPICRPFWTWAVIGSAAIGGLLALWLLWRFIDYKLKTRAALRAQAARDRVDYEAIEREKWVGDVAYSGDVSGEEIERRIAEALKARKAETPSNSAAT